MIRGVDRRVRKAIKDAAKAEGTSVGTWVLRALQRSLETAEGAPATVEGLKERMRLVEARMEVLEKSHRRLHQKVQAANHRIEKPQAKNVKYDSAPGNRAEAPGRSRQLG